MTYGCEILFNRERGAAMQALIEGATGEPCPCKQGRICPLLPADQKPTGKIVITIEPAA